MLSVTGCVNMMFPKEVNLEAQGQYAELEQYWEPKVKAKTNPSFSDLYLLCKSYANVKKYSKLFPCLNRLEERVNVGNSNYYTDDLSHFPWFARSQAFMELGQMPKALEQAELAHKIGVKKDIKRFYMVLVLANLGLSHAMNGNLNKAAASQ